MNGPTPDDLRKAVAAAEAAGQVARDAAHAATQSAEQARQTEIDIKLSKQDKRPHAWTIGLGIGSVTLTMVAIGFTWAGFKKTSDSLVASQRGLAVSEDSLHIGQRAYLGVKQGRLKLINQKVRPSQWDPNQKANGGWSYTNPKDKNRIDWKHLRAEYSFNLENVGNSPATVKSITFTLRTPSDWTISGTPPESVQGHLTPVKGNAPPNIVLEGEAGQEVEPHSTFFLRYDPALVLSERAAEYESHKMERMGGYKLDEGTFYFYPNSSRLVVRGDIVYEDIFHQEHLVHWCWAHTYLTPFTESCTANEADPHGH